MAEGPTTIEQARDALHLEADRLNEAILGAQTKLQQLKLGVTASVLLREDDGYHTWLCFRRLTPKGAWGLLIEVEPPEDKPGDTLFKPLVNASREMRVLASEHLDALLVELERELNQSREEVQGARIRFREFTTQVERLSRPRRGG